MQAVKSGSQSRSNGHTHANLREATTKRKLGALRPDLAHGFEADERLQDHLAKKLKLRKVICLKADGGMINIKLT
jgi:hypothetical protein